MRILCKALSTYHLDLLKQNNVVPTYFLVRSNSDFLDKIKEQFPGSIILDVQNEMVSINLISSIKNNLKLYASLKKDLSEQEIDRLILFSDNKPLDKFLINFYLNNETEVELWEDGLGHYIGSCTNIFYYKSLFKLLQGFFPKGIFNERYNRKIIMIRDRFQYKNLSYTLPEYDDKIVKKESSVIFIGQPLVEDNYLSEKMYLVKLSLLQKELGLQLDYLPHPRENLAKYYKNVDFNIIKANTSAEEFCTTHKYRLYLSVFSTTLVNINKYDRSKFVAGFFGLKKVHKALNSATFLPIKSFENLADDTST